MVLPVANASLADVPADVPVAAKPDKSVLKSTRRDPIAKLTAEALDSVWQAAGLSPDGKLTAAVEG